jgi:hypothetical protein
MNLRIALVQIDRLPLFLDGAQERPGRKERSMQTAGNQALYGGSGAVLSHNHAGRRSAEGGPQHSVYGRRAEGRAAPGPLRLRRPGLQFCRGGGGPVGVRGLPEIRNGLRVEGKSHYSDCVDAAPERILVRELLNRPPESVSDAEIETALRLVMPGCKARVVGRARG